MVTDESLYNEKADRRRSTDGTESDDDDDDDEEVVVALELVGASSCRRAGERAAVGNATCRSDSVRAPHEHVAHKHTQHTALAGVVVVAARPYLSRLS